MLFTLKFYEIFQPDSDWRIIYYDLVVPGLLF